MTRDTHHPIHRIQQDARWVHRLARGLLRDRHLAADVAQEALVVGLTKASAAGPAQRSWLAGVTRRVARNALRREHERRERDLLAARPASASDEERTVDRLRVHEELARAVRELPEPYRTAVTLRFFDGVTPRAIARRQGISAGAARLQIHRGLAMLRERLDGEYGDRSKWALALWSLGLDRLPLPPAIPRLALPAVLAAAVVFLGAVVVVATWWSDNAAKAGAAPAEDRHETAMTPGDPADFMEQPVATPTPRAVQDPERIRGQVDRYLDALAGSGLFSGCALIARGEEVLVSKAWGYANRGAAIANTTRTRFKLMSTSKAFTAVTVLRLVQAGDLALTDRVADLVPEWPVAWAAVTVHDLLDHTSGIPNLEGAWVAHGRTTGKRGQAAFGSFVKATRIPPLESEPGTRMRYSNFHYELAGVVAERVSGLALPELMHGEVFAPAGLEDTGFDDGSRREGLAVGYFLGDADEPQESRQDMSVIRAAGGLWSSVLDLHRFDRALAGDALLDETSKALMHTPRRGGYACGWQTTPVHGQRCLHHSGGANGYVADFLRFPDSDVCIAVLSNHAFVPISRLSADLAAITFGVQVEFPIAAGEASLAKCAGVFGFSDGDDRGLLVRRCGGLLVAFECHGDQPRSSGRVLLVTGEGRCSAPWDSGELVFRADRVETPQGVLQRAADPAPAWRAACGDYRAAEGQARLEHDGGRFLLRVPIHPGKLEIVPVTEARALAMVMSELGTRVLLTGNGLSWTTADGRVLRLRPVE